MKFYPCIFIRLCFPVKINMCQCQKMCCVSQHGLKSTEAITLRELDTGAEGPKSIGRAGFCSFVQEEEEKHRQSYKMTSSWPLVWMSLTQQSETHCLAPSSPASHSDPVHVTDGSRCTLSSTHCLMGRRSWCCQACVQARGRHTSILLHFGFQAVFEFCRLIILISITVASFHS